MTTRRSVRSPSARPATTRSCCVAARLHRPAHRLRHRCDERPPVGRHDVRRRGLRREPRLFHLEGRSRRSSATRTGADAPGPRRRAPARPDAHQCVVPGNMYFTTTASTRNWPAASFVDLIIDEAHDPAASTPSRATSTSPSCERVIGGRRRPHPVCLHRHRREHGRRPADQPRQPPQGPALCGEHGIRIIHDATRVAENAYLIKSGSRAMPKGRRGDRPRDLRPRSTAAP